MENIDNIMLEINNTSAEVSELRNIRNQMIIDRYRLLEEINLKFIKKLKEFCDDFEINFKSHIFNCILRKGNYCLVYNLKLNYEDKSVSVDKGFNIDEFQVREDNINTICAEIIYDFFKSNLNTLKAEKELLSNDVDLYKDMLKEYSYIFDDFYPDRSGLGTNNLSNDDLCKNMIKDYCNTIDKVGFYSSNIKKEEEK